MMKKLFLVMAALALLSLSVVANAEVVERTYYFTGADLINNYASGSYRNSDDGSLYKYEGMRSLFPGTEFTYTGSGANYLGATGSWATNFNNLWSTAVADGRVLSTFWLSGMDGNAGQWGEDYKPFEWVSGTGPAGWTFSTQTDTAPTPGYLTDQHPVWTTSVAGLALDSAQLASQQFSVTIKFDTANMWWGNPDNYVYGAATAPNSLDSLTMVFGSYLSKGETDINLYEGNMNAAVPEPSSIIALLGGLGSLLAFRRRKA